MNIKRTMYRFLNSMDNMMNHLALQLHSAGTSEVIDIQNSCSSTGLEKLFYEREREICLLLMPCLDNN